MPRCRCRPARPARARPARPAWPAGPAGDRDQGAHRQRRRCYHGTHADRHCGAARGRTRWARPGRPPVRRRANDGCIWPPPRPAASWSTTGTSSRRTTCRCTWATTIPRTAWTEGVKGTGTSEWLRVRVTPMEGATRVRLRVRNGYQKTARLFAANARAAGRHGRAAALGQDRRRRAGRPAGLAGGAGRAAGGAARGRRATLRGSVYPGTKYDDLCISDVQLLVTADDARQPRVREGPPGAHPEVEGRTPGGGQAVQDRRRQEPAGRPAIPGPGRRQTRGEAGQGQVQERLAVPHATRCCERARKDAAASQTHAARWVGRWPWSRASSASMVPVQAVARDKRKLPAVDGLCSPGMNSCFDDGCFEAFPLPGTGQVAFLQTVRAGRARRDRLACAGRRAGRQAEGVPPARRDQDLGLGPAGQAAARTAPPRWRRCCW